MTSHDANQTGGGVPVAVSPAAPLDVVAGYRLAHLGDRLLAVILDTLLGAGMFAVIGMWSAVRWGGVTASGFSVRGTAALVPISMTLVAGFLYYWMLEALAGATLGKAILGIQVRRADGAKCGLRPALFRNLLRVIDGIALYLVGFLVAIFSKRRQRLGDHIGGTVVVERGIGRLGRAALVIVWLACIVGSAAGAWLLHRGVPVSTSSGTVSSGSNSTPASTETTGTKQPLVLTSGDFKLLHFAWTEGKDGPNVAATYKPGDEVFAKYDLVGFTTDSQGRMDVTLAVTAVDPAGLALDKTWSDTVRSTVADTDTPINGSAHFRLPAFAPEGIYTLVIKAHDAVKNSGAEFNPTFTVAAASAIPPASQLEIRNFRFSTSQGGPSLSPAVYEPGQTVHYSYELFGMQFRDDRANFHIAFRLTGPDGQTFMDRPDWDTTDDSFVYHPGNFFLHFGGYITMPPDTAKGTYTERFVVTDKVADRTLSHEATFEVR